MTKDLVVPLGVAPNGRLVAPTEAERGVVHRCPGCKHELVLNRGPIKVAHFSHKPTDANHAGGAAPEPPGACQQESLLHETAKMLVAQVITEWKAETGPCPRVTGRCGREGCRREAKPTPLPDRITSARVEMALAATGSGPSLRPDVTLLQGEKVVAAVEILHTHAVTSEKRATFREQRTAWLELGTDAVLADPIHWVAINNGRPGKLRCEPCVAREDKINRLARQFNLLPLPAGYRVEPIPCYSCHRDMLVFSWCRRPFSREPPPSPKPRTVQLRYSETLSAKYWANVCPMCNRIQGDYFLYADPAGPFYEAPACVEMEEIDDTNRAALYATMGPRIHFH